MAVEPEIPVYNGVGVGYPPPSSALSQSRLLHVSVNVNLARSQVHAPLPPDLVRVDPRVNPRLRW